MTIAALKDEREPDPSMGWVDGFSSEAIDEAAYLSVYISSGLYALLWPGAAQGDISAVSQRLLRTGEHCRVIPAQMGQKITSLAGAQRIANDHAERLTALLERLGDTYQYTLIVPLDSPAAACAPADLRAKHAALQKHKAALDAASDTVKDMIRPLEKYSREMQSLTAIAADKVALHILVSKTSAARFEAAFRANILPHHETALIGPMPPFVFSRCTGEETTAR